MPDRASLRQQLKTTRQTWLQGPAGLAAPAQQLAALQDLLTQLEPTCLGLYWPLPGELDVSGLRGWPLALPFAQREPRALQYRRWDGSPPDAQDGMGIATSSGAPAEPDVVLVPCLGFTREGYRLGYGGGFFDRWLAAHPGVTAVGLAWSVGECQFAIEPHDRPLSILLTETELIAP